MSVFNQSRARVIQIIFVVIFIIIAIQLINLQLFSNQYKIAAENNAIYRKVIYPDRGIIYDRQKKPILENTIMFDLMVTPGETRGTDTGLLCKILNIDTSEYRKRIVTAIIKNTSYKPSVFEGLLTQELYAKLNENMYRFPGFTLSDRSVRSYPYHTAPHVLGYIAEVDTSFLRRNAGQGYQMGDYTGMTGLERTYEKVLMGQRGIKLFLRDNKNRIQGPYENGMYDSIAVAGRSLYTSLDVDVQQLAEKLLQNKIGSAVAINPKTGGIIAMASSPGYDPNELTGSFRRKNFSRMFLDTAKPLLNRAIKGQYPPGSTFKPLGALIALDQRLITPSFGVPCCGAYYACGIRVNCTHKDCHHSQNVRLAIANSCNSYFSKVFQMVVDNPKINNPRNGYQIWKDYVNGFGLGVKLEVDLPSENAGNIQDTSKYDRQFGSKKWGSCFALTLGIGQDRMLATPLQMANMMCAIANKGFYYHPHFVDSIENENGEDKAMLAKFRKKHQVVNISDSAYEAVFAGMEDVTIYGTATRSRIPGVRMCAKTGTAQNPHGKEHAMFVAFAPRENPQIAIAVVVENGGYGSTSAAPIASLMIEQYLHDSISTPRLAEVERLAKMDLMPAAIKKWYYRRDSIRQSKIQIDENTPVENSVEDRKNTFDPEAEPGRKEAPLPEQKNKMPIIAPDQRKNKKPTITT